MRAALILLAATPLFAQPVDLQPPAKPDPMPASARPAVEKCEKAIAEARKVYEAACLKAHAQAVKDLEPAVKTETQKGNLDGALLVKSKIEEYKKDLVAKAEQDAVANLKTQIVGRWSWFGGRTAVFRADGTASQLNGTAKFADGKWREEKGAIEVEWNQTDGIFRDSIALNGDAGKAVSRTMGFRYDMKRLGD